MSRYTRKVSSRLGRYERQKFGGFGHEGPAGRHLDDPDYRRMVRLNSPEYWYHSCNWGKCQWIVKNSIDEAVSEERNRQQQRLQYQIENQRDRLQLQHQKSMEVRDSERKVRDQTRLKYSKERIFQTRLMLGAGGLVIVGLILVLALTLTKNKKKSPG